MSACIVCGTGVRDDISRCTSCGALLDNPGGSFVPLAAVAPTPSAVVPAREVVRRPLPTRTVGVVLVAFALACTVVALIAAPRLYPQVDPQRFVGTWVYTSGAPGQIDITRTGQTFTIAFVGRDGTRQFVPGTVQDGKLVLDYAALGADGAVVQQKADAMSAVMSFVYRQDRDRLVMTAGNASQGRAAMELRRSGPVAL